MNIKGCSILIPLLIGMLFSCTSKQYDGITYLGWDDFPEPMFLEGDSVEFDDILMKPTRIAIVDSFMLMKNSNVERFFHVYNLKTKQKVGERIPFGIGPDEMLDPIWVLMPDSCLGVFDRNKKKMHIYSKNQFLNSDKTSPICQLVFDELLINPIFISGIGVVSSTLESEDNKFVIVGLDGEKIAYFGEFPEYYKDMTVFEKNIALMGDMAVKPDFSRWVMSHKATDMIEIYVTAGQRYGSMASGVSPSTISPHSSTTYGLWPMPQRPTLPTAAMPSMLPVSAKRPTGFPWYGAAKTVQLSKIFRKP